MNTKVIAISIAAFIGIIVLGSVLMPILDDSTSTEEKFKNEGLFYLDKIDTSSSITAVWDPTDPTNITVNDVEIALPQSSSFPLTLIASETWGLRYIAGNDASVTLFDNTAATKTTVSVQSTNSLEITISGGTATFVNGTSTYTESFTDGFIIAAEDGGYVMKDSNKDAYLNGDSLIYSTGRTGGLNTLTTNTVSIHLDGTIDDGVNVSMVYPGTYTTSNIEINKTEVSDYLDLYSFSSVTFTVTDALSNTANATYSQVIVPTEVTAEKAVHFTDGQNAILKTIPMLIIVAILVGVVALVIRSRLD